MNSSFPLEARSADEALDKLLTDTTARLQFFCEPDDVDSLVRSEPDLQKLYERACDLFERDNVAALKLMFHIFFQSPYGFGMHHVYDAIGLYMGNAMNDEIREYIRAQWKSHVSSLSEDDKVWWRRESRAWGCELPDD